MSDCLLTKLLGYDLFVRCSCLLCMAKLCHQQEGQLHQFDSQPMKSRERMADPNEMTTAEWRDVTNG